MIRREHLGQQLVERGELCRRQSRERLAEHAIDDLVASAALSEDFAQTDAIAS
jgi:hypothetical protein